MGVQHIKGYRETQKAEIVAICDTDKGVLDKVSAEYNITNAYFDYKDILKDPEIGAVSIASPDFCHREQCLDAIAAHKHVLCEKPLALTEEDCNAIIEAASKAQTKFMVGQICRYSPPFKMAKKLIEDGKIGELFFVESEYCHNYSHAAGVGEWRKSTEFIREPFLGGACHAVDLLRWIAGEIKEVTAYSNHKTMPDWPVQDCTVAIMKMDRGIIGKVTCSIGCVRPYTMRSVFYGEKGTIICDNVSKELQLCTRELQIDDRFKFVNIPVAVASHNIRLEIEEFIQCINNDEEVKTGASEGAKTVKVCLAAIKSAKENLQEKVK